MTGETSQSNPFVEKAWPPTALQKAPMAAGLVAISFLGFLFFILILVRAAMRHHLRLRELRRGLDAEKETPGDAPRAS